MKRAFVVVLLIFSLSFLCGYAPKSTILQLDDFIMLSLDLSSNGEIVQSVDFSVNSERITNDGSSVKELLDFRNALAKAVETLRNEFLFSFALAYMANPIEEYKINKGVVLTPVTYDEQSDSIGFKMGFASSGAWNYYHPSSNDEGGQEGKNKNIFMNKIESKGTFPFSAEVKSSENQLVTVGRRYKEKYIESAKNLSFYEKLKSSYSPTFIYNYSTFNNKLHSDADFNFADSNNHLHHVWLLGDEELNSDNSITLYYYSIERGIWLVFAITIPLVCMIIAIILIKIKEKSRKKR